MAHRWAGRARAFDIQHGSLADSAAPLPWQSLKDGQWSARDLRLIRVKQEEWVAWIQLRNCKKEARIHSRLLHV